MNKIQTSTNLQATHPGTCRPIIKSLNNVYKLHKNFSTVPAVKTFQFKHRFRSHHYLCTYWNFTQLKTS